jgi:hypothetical protein
MKDALAQRSTAHRSQSSPADAATQFQQLHSYPSGPSLSGASNGKICTRVSADESSHGHLLLWGLWLLNCWVVCGVQWGLPILSPGMGPPSSTSASIDYNKTKQASPSSCFLPSARHSVRCDSFSRSVGDGKSAILLKLRSSSV